jgi:hypothetical protein
MKTRTYPDLPELDRAAFQAFADAHGPGLMKIFEGKNGKYVTFEKTGAYWTVRLRTGSGDTADKVVCDDYRLAVEYRKSFLKSARSAT